MHCSLNLSKIRLGTDTLFLLELVRLILSEAAEDRVEMHPIWKKSRGFEQ